MRLRIWVLLPILALALVVAVPQVAWADDDTEMTEGETGEETGEEDDGATEAVPVDITAALDSVNAAIDALSIGDEIKARLKETVQARLSEAANRGFTAEQVQALANQMGILLGQVDLTRDLSHLNAACQFMIKAMRLGLTAEQAFAMIASRLAAGEDLKRALREARVELKGMEPKGKGHGNDGDDEEGHGHGHGKG